MSISSYRSYKNSGVEWLGEIPVDWSLGKFRHLFTESTEKIESEVHGEMLSVSGYRGIEVKEYSDENQKRTDENLIGYRIVHVGQLVVNTMWLNYAGLGISQLEGHVSPAYRGYWVDSNLHKPFVHHLMRSSLYVLGYTKYLTGVRPNSLQMSREDLMNFPILMPTLTEQIAIANFLDHETAKIDTLIAEQEKLIQLLKEKRQAVISQAVTNGLDSKVKMKDSGVEWLGRVPDHWDVVPLKYFVHMKSGEQITSEQIRDEGDFPVYGGNGLRGYFEKYTHDGEYPLIGRQGALCGNINYASGKFWASEHAVVVTPKKMANIFYLGELLRSMNLGQYSTSAAQPGLSVEAIGNLRIPAPIIEEQNKIANYLLTESGKWESLIEAATLSISLFQERRSALISAAVTGQIDVRNYQRKEAE